MFFLKKLKKKFTKFLWAENFFDIWKKISKKNIFFKKIKFLFIGIKNFFLPPKIIFVKNKVSDELFVC